MKTRSVTEKPGAPKPAAPRPAAPWPAAPWPAAPESPGGTSLLIAGVAALALAALTLGLANWQWQRSLQKVSEREAAALRRAQPPLAVRGALPSDAAPYTRLRLSGRWRHERTLFLDNQVRQGRAGYFVLTPFVPAGSSTAVLVNRGWMPKTFGADPSWQGGAAEEADLIVEARLWPNRRPLLRRGAVVQGMNSGEIAAALGFDPGRRLWLEQSGRHDRLLRVWPAPAEDEINMHRSYAGQWLLFTLMIVGAYGFYVYRSRPR